MKKKLMIICTVIALITSIPNNAHALIIDASTLAAKISEWVGKLTEATTKITQQVSQIKQMTSQGFNKENLFNIAQHYMSRNGDALLKIKMEKIVEGTKKKNREKIDEEKTLYVDNKNLYYDEKIGIMDESIQKTEEELQKKQEERDEKKVETDIKKNYYETVKNDFAKEPKALDDYKNAWMQYEELVVVCNELDDLLETLKKQKTVLEEEKKKVGTEEDPEYMLYEKRLEELDSEKEEADGDEDAILNKSSEEDEEWDSEKVVDDFSPTEEDYNAFLARYFYNPEDLSSAENNDFGETKTDAEIKSDERVKHQTKIDAAMRERRFLLVNSAAHLLQVTATLRREIPERSETIDEIFQNTPAASGELEAISSYSATRIESMKALLMYAKLQSARLQYMAAKKLLSLDVIKVPNNEEIPYTEFNLERYILTQEDVDKAIEEANTENSAIKELEEKNVNAGDD